MGLNLVDNPGFLIGQDAEEEGTVRIGSRALMACYQASVPWVSVIIRRCYGVAGAGHGNADRLNLRYAWPSAEIAVMGAQGAIEVLYSKDIKALKTDEEKQKYVKEKEDEYNCIYYDVLQSS